MFFFCQLTFCFKYHTFPLLYVFYYHQTSKCIRIHDIVSKITKGPKVGWEKGTKKLPCISKNGLKCLFIKNLCIKISFNQNLIRNVWNIFEEACGHFVILEPMYYHYINEIVLEYIKMYRNTSKYVKHSISKNDLTSLNLKL